MLNRSTLLSSLEGAAKLPADVTLKADALYDKLIVLVALQTTLDQARRLSGSSRNDLRTFVRGAMTLAELKRLSKVWDPQRKVASEITQTELSRDLCELLDGRRQPEVKAPKSAKKKSAKKDVREAA
jgi:hypothetical protein